RDPHLADALGKLGVVKACDDLIKGIPAGDYFNTWSLSELTALSQLGPAGRDRMLSLYLSSRNPGLRIMLLLALEWRELLAELFDDVQPLFSKLIADGLPKNEREHYAYRERVQQLGYTLGFLDRTRGEDYLLRALFHTEDEHVRYNVARQIESL